MCGCERALLGQVGGAGLRGAFCCASPLLLLLQSPSLAPRLPPGSGCPVFVSCFLCFFPVLHPLLSLVFGRLLPWRSWSLALCAPSLGGPVFFSRFLSLSRQPLPRSFFVVSGNGRPGAWRWFSIPSLPFCGLLVFFSSFSRFPWFLARLSPVRVLWVSLLCCSSFPLVGLCGPVVAAAYCPPPLYSSSAGIVTLRLVFPCSLLASWFCARPLGVCWPRSPFAGGVTLSLAFPGSSFAF